ncbi:Hpt domain-containing protein [Shimia gijangensis]|uniref:Hpt domain-containing protein n=1 Tax=Shimia gijangensis TaxID=1470563 RepID=A0A1M6GJY4_9RHOB|nr:Hpt domain-containing protein [Shimia gijangensis]SHJ10233.1 Hpt domain-containing protein [Shimia gijangensis]
MTHPAPKPHDHLEKHLSVLRVQFHGSLRKKETELEEVICDIAAFGADQDRLSRLFYIAHSLVGVAPTYRFNDLATAAEKVEALVDQSNLIPGRQDIAAEPVLMAADEMAEEMRKALKAGPPRHT